MWESVNVPVGSCDATRILGARIADLDDLSFLLTGGVAHSPGAGGRPLSGGPPGSPH